ncbi:MAG TPA: hypothetical protein VK108_06070 [Pseudogracilibacillus sp.]|nr:hypothetical protein [Pseudogracilibacillus sp.]
MKKYLIFIGSFIVLFFTVTMAMEWLSGFLLTSSFAPDMNKTWHMGRHAPGERNIGFNGTFLNYPFWSALISAILSFWLANKNAE